MAGLLGQAAMVGTPPPEEEMVGDTDEMDEEEPPASPEDQDTFETVVNQAIGILYDKSRFKQVKNQIESTIGDEVPFSGLSALAATTMAKVKGDAAKAGVDVSEAVLLKATATVVEDLANLSNEADIYDFPQPMVDGAYIRAVDNLRQQLQERGLIDIEAHKQKMQGYIDADKNGTLLKDMGFNRQTRRALPKIMRKE